MTQNFEHYRWL